MRLGAFRNLFLGLRAGRSNDGTAIVNFILPSVRMPGQTARPISVYTIQSEMACREREREVVVAWEVTTINVRQMGSNPVKNVNRYIFTSRAKGRERFGVGSFF